MTTQEGPTGLHIEIHQEQVSSATSVGGREYNEDSCVSIALDPSVNPWHLSAVLAVADGLGGHSAGDVASQIAIALLEEVFVEDNIGTLSGITHESDPGDALEALFLSVNDRIYSYASDDGSRNMGTTLTAVLVVDDGRAVVGHVGDSRMYLVEGEEAHQITVDHSPVGRLLEAGILTEREAVQRDDRNIVDQALGTDPHVKVDIVDLNLSMGDILVLTTDGLSNVIFSDELPSIVRAYPTVNEAVAGLVHLAIERDTDDNATAAVLAVGGPEAAGFAAVAAPVEEYQELAAETVITVGTPVAAAVEGMEVIEAHHTLEHEPETKEAEHPQEQGERHAAHRGSARIVVGLICGLILAAGVVIALIFGLSGGEKRVTVPNVNSMMPEQARAKVEKAGLKFAYEYAQRNDEEPGKIVKQSPTEGERVKEGSLVTVLVTAKGKVDLPDLVGQDSASAEKLLKELFLNLAVQRDKVADQSQDGKVIGQHPGASRVDAGSDVILVVAFYEAPPRDTTPRPQPTTPTGHWIKCLACGGSGSISEPVTRTKQVTCPKCLGQPLPGEETCSECGGSGKITETSTIYEPRTCPTCGGKGKVWEAN